MSHTPLCSRDLPYVFNSLGRELFKTPALDVPNSSMSPGLALKLNSHVKIQTKMGSELAGVEEGQSTENIKVDSASLLIYDL